MSPLIVVFVVVSRVRYRGSQKESKKDFFQKKIPYTYSPIRLNRELRTPVEADTPLPHWPTMDT